MTNRNLPLQVMMSSQHTTTSNVWSAGVMLYVLLSQHWPFFGNTKEELIQSIFSGQYFVHPCVSLIIRLTSNIYVFFENFESLLRIIILQIILFFIACCLNLKVFPTANHVKFQWSYELRHLFHCMLSVQPSRRLSATQILRHPWFRLCEAMEVRHKLNLRSSSEQQYTRSTSDQPMDADK